jgi:hypothetical protein
MKISPSFTAKLFVAASVIGWLTALGYAQAVKNKNNAARKEKQMTTQAKGSFEVKLTPQEDKDNAAGRTLIDKQFHGDLEATSKGQMLAAMTSVKGSAGYVAIEKVTGALHGRKGSFVLQHSSTMTRGVPQQSVTVIPDSGTEELEGLSGRMTIIIADGKHSYEFDYTIDKTP